MPPRFPTSVEFVVERTLTSSSRKPKAGPLQQFAMADGSPAKFGSVRFPGSKRLPAKWAAISAKTEPSQVGEMLLSTWHLPPPRVLISVTGAASGSIANWPAKEQLVFRRGLLKAAHTTNAWVVTGGTHAGVMKMVGKMLQEDDSNRPVVCIGIATWGSIYLHKEMQQKQSGKVYNYESTEVGCRTAHAPRRLPRPRPRIALTPSPHCCAARSRRVTRSSRSTTVRR